MNIDLYGLFEFGDEDGVKQFVFAHRFTHDFEAQALQAQFGANIDTYGLDGNEIVDPWIDLMRGQGKEDGQPRVIADWLEVHNENHQLMLSYLGSTGTVSDTDLSQVDFSDPDQMAQWLTLHQYLHEFEQQALGLT